MFLSSMTKTYSTRGAIKRTTQRRRAARFQFLGALLSSITGVATHRAVMTR